MSLVFFLFLELASLPVYCYGINVKCQVKCGGFDSERGYLQRCRVRFNNVKKSMACEIFANRRLGLPVFDALPSVAGCWVAAKEKLKVVDIWSAGNGEGLNTAIAEPNHSV